MGFQAHWVWADTGMQIKLMRRPWYEGMKLKWGQSFILEDFKVLLIKVIKFKRKDERLHKQNKTEEEVELTAARVIPVCVPIYCLWVSDCILCLRERGICKNMDVNNPVLSLGYGSCISPHLFYIQNSLQFSDIISQKETKVRIWRKGRQD